MAAAKKMTPFYTIKEEWRRYEVMKVTSEKAGYHQQYYGSIAGVPTHCRPSSTYGKFLSEADANLAFGKVAAIKAEHNPLIQEARQELDRRQQAQHKALQAYFATLETSLPEQSS